MSSPLTNHKFPTAYVSGQQIAYVTDNDRDAEALSCEMESPVVSEWRDSSIRHDYSTIIVRQTSQTPETSKRPDVSDVRDVSKGSPAINAPDALDALGALDVSGIWDSSDVQTFDL